jgi:hypothetical protein
MDRKWPLLTTVCLFLFGNFQTYSASPPRDKAHQLAQAASQISPAQCNGIATMEDCHGFLASGCTAAGHYDAYLSYLKNQRPFSSRTARDCLQLKISTTKNPKSLMD